VIDYGNYKLNQIFNDTWPNLGWAKRMTEPLHAKVSEEDYNKIVDLMNNQQPYPDEMFEEAERREKSNRVLQRYNDFYNMECAGMPHGTPITPEHMQMIAFESMIDALRLRISIVSIMRLRFLILRI
jgi:hypothetical protein